MTPVTVANKLFGNVSYVLRDGRYAIRVGALTIPQSSFLIAAAVIVGFGGGIGAVLFRRLIAFENWIAFSGIGGHLGFLGPAAVIVQLAIGGIIAAWITTRFAPEAKGHGVPEVMEAVALRGGKMRPRIIAI